jgi:hypothetical protein
MAAAWTALTPVVSEVVGKSELCEGCSAHAGRGSAVDEKLRRAIEKSFKAQKKKPPKVVGEVIETPKRGYYALRVAGFVD